MRISAFRGWQELDLRPGRHAVVVGEPRAGRTDLVEALRRVLDPDSTRSSPSEFDVHLPWQAGTGDREVDDDAPVGANEDIEQDTEYDGDVDVAGDGPEVRQAEVEVVLSDLGETLEQHFFRRLELWDVDDDALVVESMAEQIDEERHELVLRLCYRLVWRAEEGTGEHWVDYPKTSVPDDGVYDRARRPDRLVLPFLSLEAGQSLTLRSGSAFRELLASGGDDLAAALQALSEAVDGATDGFSANAVVRTVLSDVFDLVRGNLKVDSDAAIEDIVGFRAEGGSVAGLLRALQPTLRLGTQDALPLRRHGSTTAAVLAAAEILVAARRGDAVVVCDDFGDQLDAGAAEHLARELRRSCGQLWLSTRRPEAARSFQPAEMIRLSRHDGERQAFQLAEPTNRHELVAMRQLHHQLLPAMSNQAVVVFEGAHDVSALTAVSQRMCTPPPPAAYGVRLIDAGGHGGVSKVCGLARRLGFRVVAGLDFDEVGVGADTSFTAVQKVADEVVRLPEGFAIERALIHGIDRTVLIRVFGELDTQWGLDLTGLEDLDERRLARKLEKQLKQKSGLHAQYVALLPRGHTPRVVVDLLRTAVALARGLARGPVTLTA